MAVTEKDVRNALKGVKDPELLRRFFAEIASALSFNVLT